MNPTPDLVIDVHHLSKNFGPLMAVVDLSLQVKRGEIFGFLGPNGSGKTTTIRMLCGLLTPDAGEGHCLGYDILTQSGEIKKHVGYMTQKFSYYEDLTVEENLNFIAHIFQIENPQDKVEEYLKRFDFLPRRNQLAGELSGGWKQRLALAASLIHDPQLLLLDEPTAGVDPKARRDFWDTIHDLSMEGITTLVSTHYMDEAERCTRLAYIAYGHLLVQGTISEVIHEVGLYTYLVRGPQMAHLAKELKNKPGIDQLVLYGEHLHVSGKDLPALEAAIAPYRKNKDYNWEKIDSNLEDAFINLVAET